MEIDFKKIKECNEEIQKLLEEHPELKEWWDEVQEKMDKAGPNNRLAVAEDLLMIKFRELSEKLIELQKATKGYKK